MKAITRQPKLLVKMSAAPQRLSLAAGATQVDLAVEPLFKSIEDKPGMGLAAAPQWQLVTAADEAGELNAWELCHHMMKGDLGIAGVSVEFAEPDLEQRWIVGTDVQSLMAATASCERPQDPDTRLPVGNGVFWFRDDVHSQLEAALAEVGQPASRVRIAHFDTGYDPKHFTTPKFLRTDLQRNFEDGDPNDARDTSDGVFNNLGHGVGTLGLLAGAMNGSPLGGAAFLDVIPVRVANSVVLFKNSSIAKAFDYVHSLANNPNTQCHVITMSMGGLASRAWAEAVNALYEIGVFIVTAAGNNFGNFPTRHIVYPARFKRVIAACGVMADGRPYADLPLRIMAGNYGPDSKMRTALAAYTPNTPWPRMGCDQLVDHDGRGTSAATPQIAAAAALWIQKHKSRLDAYSQGWMRVEAVRKALYESAASHSSKPDDRLGQGVIRAKSALAQEPANESALKKEDKDSASFPFLRVITGLGIAAPDARQQMLELEALQLTQQSKELEELLPDPEREPHDLSPAERQKFIDALASTPGASRTLREALGDRTRVARPQISVPKELTPQEQTLLQRAINPPQRMPNNRPLRVFAFDPLAATKLETLGINETTIPVRWENLEPGPVGDYLEVIDIDPATGAAYAPIDLNQPWPLSQAGLRPSEANPQFHQQMVYAVAMKTVEHFEKALGRVALWAPRIVKLKNGKYENYYVPRLRIYPHALREANAYYSPDKHALLFGYFRASTADPGDNLPGQTVFTCLSHDIVAHETTHALLDGLHRRFREPTNADILGFHEAFADIVALFQHFTVPEALRDQIAKTRGDLGQQSLLGQLAQQFGHGIGRYGALRDSLGTVENGKWVPSTPSPSDYKNATEAHDRGAVLVAAVFDAFLSIYRKRSADLLRLATGGTGVLPEGDIPHDLVNRLAHEASKTASHILNMCIRALDYSPPVDMKFGDYVRALITADRDLVPDDDLGYRVAFLQAFRRRGIYPEFVRNLSSESVCWDSPELEVPIEEALKLMTLTWDLHANRRGAYHSSLRNAGTLNLWLKDKIDEEQARSLGFSRKSSLTVGKQEGRLSPFEVHSVRPVRRVGPDGQQRLDLVVEITQNWLPDNANGEKYRGGSTLIIDIEQKRLKYVVRKRVGHAQRISNQQGFRMALADTSIRSNYYDDIARGREPFAMLHRGA